MSVLKPKYYIQQILHIGDEQILTTATDVEFQKILFGDILIFDLKLGKCDIDLSLIDFVEVRVYENKIMSDDILIVSDIIDATELVRDEDDNICLSCKMFVE